MSANHSATHHITEFYANVSREAEASRAIRTPEVPQNTLDKSSPELSSGSPMLPSDPHSHVKYQLPGAEFTVSTLFFINMKRTNFNNNHFTAIENKAEEHYAPCKGQSTHAWIFFHKKSR